MVHPTSAGPVNTATRTESPNPAVQSPSVRAAMESFDKSLNPIRQPNRQGKAHPEGVNVRGEGPAVPEPAETSRPNKTSDSTTWPQENKWALASAAANALTSSPLNAGKNISARDIVDILDQSPTYTELCQILEHRGFIMNRGQFARLLLAAIPIKDTNSPVSQRSNLVNVPNMDEFPDDGAANGTVHGAVSGAVNGSVDGAVNGRVNRAAQKTSAQNESPPQSLGKDVNVNGFENGTFAIQKSAVC